MDNLTSVEVRMQNQKVGTVALTAEGLCAFQYNAEWLTTGFSISPFKLPLKNEVFIAKRTPFEGGFGVFDDCLPDGWGLLNFAFIRKKDNWHFAPAFDLLPANGIGGYHTTSFNGSITPNDNDLLTIAQKVGLDVSEAQKVLNGMRKTIDSRCDQVTFHLC